MCHFRPSLQRWKFRRRGALRSNKVSTFFYNCIRMSSFPSLAHRALFLSQNPSLLGDEQERPFSQQYGKTEVWVGKDRIWQCKRRQMIPRNSFPEQLCDLMHILISKFIIPGFFLLLDWFDFCKDKNLPCHFVWKENVLLLKYIVVHSLNIFNSYLSTVWPISLSQVIKY